MQLIKLETQEQFDHLTRGDLVVVRWKPGSTEYKLGREIAHYSIVGLNKHNELILATRRNIYLIVGMYLAGESFAAEAYVLSLKVPEPIYSTMVIHDRDLEFLDRVKVAWEGE